MKKNTLVLILLIAALGFGVRFVQAGLNKENIPSDQELAHYLENTFPVVTDYLTTWEQTEASNSLSEETWESLIRLADTTIDKIEPAQKTAPKSIQRLNQMFLDFVFYQRELAKITLEAVKVRQANPDNPEEAVKELKSQAQTTVFQAQTSYTQYSNLLNQFLQIHAASPLIENLEGS